MNGELCYQLPIEQTLKAARQGSWFESCYVTLILFSSLSLSSYHHYRRRHCQYFYRWHFHRSVMECEENYICHARQRQVLCLFINTDRQINHVCAFGIMKIDVFQSIFQYGVASHSVLVDIFFIDEKHFGVVNHVYRHRCHVSKWPRA